MSHNENDPLGNRMKMYEYAEAGRQLMPLLPAMARLDGRSFSSYTKGLPRPYCPQFQKLMQDTAEHLLKESCAHVAYTQSDEITLCWLQPAFDSEIYFARKVQKMVSTLAAEAAAFFNKNATFGREKLATFDCRVWNVPNLEEAANCFVWRENDAAKNSVQSAARSEYSHGQCLGKKLGELHEMLFQKGINWNNYPPAFKRGTYFKRQVIKKVLTEAELESLPEKHNARLNPGHEFERNVVTQHFWWLAKDENRVDTLFS